MQTSVLDYLEASANKFPDKTAFFDKTQSISFGELKRCSLCLAKCILQKQITKSPILVYMPKDVMSIVAFMGILYSGNYYTPTDIKFPFSKTQKIIDILEPALIITRAALVDKLVQNGISPNKIVNIDAIDYCNKCIDSALYLKNSISTDPVYIFFTSGSTGEPKGVVITHGNIIDYIDWASSKFNISSTTIMGNQSPFYFDISTQDIYATLKMGATLAIIPEEYFVFPIKALEFIKQNNINFLYWVPSAYINIAKLRLLENFSIPSVNTMIFGGEVMPVRYLNYWRRNVPSLRCIANVCGPTETTVNYSCYIVDREFQDDEVLPLGQPLPNHELFLIDEHGHRVSEPHVLGELFVRGIALSPGYYKNPDKTLEVFVQNPLNNSFPEFVYKTGDLAFYNDHFELMYGGRKDFQIKHLGYRIELGEIEAAAFSCDRLEQACCLYNSLEQCIILLYTGNCTPDDILQSIKLHVPKYMIPGKVIKITEFPYNDNGKVDRKYLSNIYCK